jgi:hypothetical protein
MPTRLLAYLAVTFVMTMLIGVGAPPDWTLRLVFWSVTGFLAILLYGERKGYPVVLLIPFVLLLALLALKIPSTY